jgi:uncharacterized membrane protein YfcA
VGSAWRLIAASVMGVPVGLFFLSGSYEVPMKLVLASVIVTFGAYRLFRPRLLELRKESSSYLFGFLGGVLGGAYNASGPPVVIYGAMRRWPPDVFRATLQAYFLCSGSFVLVGHGIAGLWTSTVLQLYLAALPVVLIALVLGNRVNRSLPTERFGRYVHLLLIAIGLFLFVQTFQGMLSR